MSLAYLASPYNHSDHAVRWRRSRAAAEAAGRFLAAGCHVFCPIAHNLALIEASGIERGWEAWRAFDLDMLARCDLLIVLMLDGWQESKGVQGEIKEAERLDIPMRYLAWEELPPGNRAWVEIPDTSTAAGR